MAKKKVYYQCSECGHTSAKWLGHCPSCGSWHTFEEVVEEPKKQGKNRISQQRSHTTGQKKQSGTVKPKRLSEIEIGEAPRLRTRIEELDRVLGGGFMPGSLLLLGGDPGIGKSTLTLQIPRDNPDLKILYCSGEESSLQIKQRAERIGIRGDQLYLYTETRVQDILEEAKRLEPDLLIVDSIQSVYTDDLQSMPGTVSQIRECAILLQQLAKQFGITTVLIGHVTKEGDLAGPRVLEHLVDTALQFEGDSSNTYRILRSLKNRFGPTQEIGVFEMRDNGLNEIKNPSHWFIAQYDAEVSGNALVCTMEGARPLLLEVQALVMATHYSVPQRTATGFDYRRLALLLAVLEKRAHYQITGQDVYLNIAGGLNLKDTAADLGILCALASSLRDTGLLENSVIIGEVGLGGEIRAVNKMEQRLSEVKKLGFSEVICPNLGRIDSSKFSELKIHQCRTLADALTIALQ